MLAKNLSCRLGRCVALPRNLLSSRCVDPMPVPNFTRTASQFRIRGATASYSDLSSNNSGRMASSAALPASVHQPASSSRPPRRQVGPFRAGIVGFLTGSVVAGIVTYFYILKEYRISNELLMGDIYSLQAAVQRTESYVRTLEDKVDTKKKRLGE